MVECTGLENRQRRKSFVSSNLTLSATKGIEMKKDIEAIDQVTNEVYQKMFKKMTALLQENDAFVVASTMLAQSLRLYKTIMPDEECLKLMNHLASQDYQDIQPFEEHNYSNTLH